MENIAIFDRYFVIFSNVKNMFIKKLDALKTTCGFKLRNFLFIYVY